MGLRIYFSLLLLGLMFSYRPALAVKIQILHTNDLHSYLEDIGNDPGQGGYARLKALFEYYRQWGTQRGIKTFIFDAGDFLEGNIFYKAKDGLQSMQAMDMLGFDAVALGNHDYLMSAAGLDNLLAESNPTFPLLAANLEMPDEFNQIREHIMPYKQFEADDIRFAVLGLTTSSSLYSWRINEGRIRLPLPVGKKWSKKLKKENDFVFALTHLGVSTDKILASSTRHIDLIIGGHSHTLLNQPLMVANLGRRLVPVVQTGEHGAHVGRMLLQLEKDNELKVLEYEMLSVDGAKDETMVAHVQGARNWLEQFYGEGWLAQVIGHTNIPLTHSRHGTTFWGDFIADATRERVDAEIGVHTVGFIGHDHDPGPITRETIIGTYPRFFELDHSQGWNIYLAKIKGSLLKLAIEIIINSGAPVNISGIKFTFSSKNGRWEVDKLSLGKIKIDPFRSYTVALPEGIARGGPYVTATYPFIFRDTKDSGFSVWDAIEDKVKRAGTLGKSTLEVDILRTRVAAPLDGEFVDQI